MLTLNSSGLTILRNLDLTDEMLLELGQPLGEILHWEFGPILTMRYDAQAPNYLFSDEAVPFHWDGAFQREPRFLLFYCTESLGAGGETNFVDTETVWDLLSSDEKEEARGVTLTYETEKLAHYGGKISVPLVQSHPVTGRTILRMAERVTSEKNPVTLSLEGAGEEFYQRMVDRLYAKSVSHSWEKGDLLLVDNFRYLHGRNPLGENRLRSFKRIQIL